MLYMTISTLSQIRIYVLSMCYNVLLRINIQVIKRNAYMQVLDNQYYLSNTHHLSHKYFDDHVYMIHQDNRDMRFRSPIC